MFQKILDETIKNFGETNHRVGTAWHNLGYIQLLTENHMEAEKSMENAVTIRENDLGNHPLVVVRIKQRH